MRCIVIFSLLAAFLPAPASADDRKDDPRCEEIKQEIREIRSRMRAGYTRAQGEKLEARLRKLRTLRRKACR